MRQSDVTKVKSQLQKLESSLQFAFNDGVTKQLAVKASQELQNNITTQHFATNYEPLDEDYAKWKRDMGFGNKFWRKTGELFLAMTRWRQVGTPKPKTVSWIAGIPDNIMNSEGESIADYAKKNEFGIGKIPKRPLFTPTAKEIMPKAITAWIGSVSKIIKTIWR